MRQGIEENLAGVDRGFDLLALRVGPRLGVEFGDPRSARSFADSLMKLVREGVVAEAVALENADNPQEFTRALRGISSSMQSTRR
ncbi:MAG: hypothetical protein WCL50_12240 [Spirochaetota bacterium]